MCTRDNQIELEWNDLTLAVAERKLWKVYQAANRLRLLIKGRKELPVIEA